MSEGEKITLVLQDDRFDVDKGRLIEKSCYFKSLFFHNFTDSQNNVQTVKYNVAPSILEDFCSWIEEDCPPQSETHKIKVSLQKYLADNFAELKQLLELSLIYSVEELSQELSDIIIQHWLKPQYLLEIWKLSRDLGLTSLIDVSYYACLERFMELTDNDLNDICNADFLLLVANVNIECSLDHLTLIINKRLNKERSCVQNENSQFVSQLNKLLEKFDTSERKPTVMPCFFVEVLKSENDQSFTTRTVYAFQYKTPAKFGEVVEVWSTLKKKDIAGIGVIGRGFSIFTIGGEIKLGSCKFNMDIWRYCLLSKKWYYVARLRKARRHMAVALVDDQLILIGGVGRYRLKLTSVEILNLKTGTWINVPGISEDFTDTPPVCVINGYVVVCVSDIYMFNPKSKEWLYIEHEYGYDEWCRVRYITSYHNTLYLGKENGSCVGYDVTWGVRQIDETKSIETARITRSEHKHFESPCEKLIISEDSRSIGIIYAFNNVTVECGKLDEDNCRLISRTHNFGSLPLISMIPVNCFNLIDPLTLNKLVTLE